MKARVRDACAKVNLTLRVLRKRADGYHDIDSLIVFVNLADRLEWNSQANAAGFALQLSGDFIDNTPAGEKNLVIQAARLFMQQYEVSLSGHVRLEKYIPIAAGLGGGSSDAAAMLDALGEGIVHEELEVLASELGADVPVCLRAQKGMRACVIRGRGEDIRVFNNLPQISLLLAKPPGMLSAGEVYRCWDKLDGNEKNISDDTNPGSMTLGDLISWCRVRENNLEKAAISLLPEIQNVLDALEESHDCLFSRMSGSGPTCFGIYENFDAVERARVALARAYPDWWLYATTTR
ncbi:MAG: 4-(cytidine 5'-diphospho)-2-C-methyl-D-erythritol kinase [Hyphomicrobiales bacterium]|nr:4-(cytidine 5'-diphospho)-2-C-methyl-D-erythritol kinase [Hyphomicrobiales bacterium]MCY4053853.1 4-(cytidine 5'-diphospho)-2-C-methyl-D-erythritol kinase [Hyphomicrobiales bacterium]